MAENNKNTAPKKPKFSPYWIYGGFIIFFIALQFFGSSSISDANKTTPSTFFNYLEEGDVEKVDIIKNTRTAKVYLTKTAEDKEVHKKSIPTSVFPTSTDLPNYTFEFGDLQNFENQLEEVNKTLADKPKISFKTETNHWGDLIFSLLPFILL